MSTNLTLVLIFAVVYSLLTSLSIVLTGDRALISGPITLASVLRLMLDWRFIVAMVLAVGSRFTFIYINHLLLGVPSLAKNSTTITALITAFSYLFIILANYWILKETITINQIAGAVLIVAGIVIILWK